MNTSAAYTPLECLLLFQSLVAYGTEPSSFVQISDLLRNNVLVKGGDTYDPVRLGEDALRDLFLQLLSDELKREGELEGQDDAGPSASKKRKLPSPALPAIKDAQDHREKLPMLVERLYARYVESMIRAIREDERRIGALKQEIAEIERGEWDESITKEDKAIANINGSISAKDSELKADTADPGGQTESQSEQSKVNEEPLPQAGPQEQEKIVKNQSAHTNGSTPPLASPRAETRPEGLAISDVLNSQDSPAPTSPRITDAPTHNRAESIAAPIHQKSGVPLGSNGPHGPPPIKPTHLQPGQPPSGHPPSGHSPPGHPQPGHQQPGSPWKWEPPYQAVSPHQPPYQQGGAYPQFNSPTYPGPQTHQPPPRGSFVVHPGLPPPHPPVPSSPINPIHPLPILLPPPNAIRRSPGSPGMPLDALADVAGQQYRAPPGSPMLQQPGPPPPGSYVQPFSPGQRPVPSNGPPHWNPQYMPPYQSPQQQYQFAPHPNQRPPFATRPEFIPPESRQYNSPYNASQGPNQPIPLHLQNQSTPRSRPSLPNTPIAQSQPRFMTGSGTRWTPNPTGSTPKPYKLTEPPEIEPLSPVLQTAKLLEPNKKPTLKEARKLETPKLSKPLQQRGTLRTRAGSTASSVIAGSRRSQSVMSHADELSMDNDIASRHVKQEVATPRGVDDLGDTTADEGVGRRRRGALRDALSPRHAAKRKRNDSIEGRKPPGPATQVLWTRAFPKISASALESISGHRNASTFALPVKERDAPGYRSLILRPQDLKSIRSAIIAGNRAAAAAASEDQTQPSVWLPISEDLIPPKAIINNGQFEKELMRMFANAIMFNADPDRGFGRSFEGKGKAEEKGKEGYEIDENGVVKDTRAMFLDVEKVVASLRSLERRSEELTEKDDLIGGDDNEVDELAGDAHGNVLNGGSIAKRRRKA